MEVESFENEEVAKLLNDWFVFFLTENDWFVSIKVIKHLLRLIPLVTSIFCLQNKKLYVAKLRTCNVIILLSF